MTGVFMTVIADFSVFAYSVLNTAVVMHQDTASRGSEESEVHHVKRIRSRGLRMERVRTDGPAPTMRREDANPMTVAR
jgi:hypothetical protein